MMRREISDALFAAADRASFDVEMVRFGEGMVGVWTNRLQDWVRFDLEIFDACNGDDLAKLLDAELRRRRS